MIHILCNEASLIISDDAYFWEGFVSISHSSPFSWLLNQRSTKEQELKVWSLSHLLCPTPMSKYASLKGCLRRLFIYLGVFKGET